MEIWKFAFAWREGVSYSKLIFERDHPHFPNKLLDFCFYCGDKPFLVEEKIKIKSINVQKSLNIFTCIA